MTEKNFYCNFYVKKGDLKNLLDTHDLELSEISTKGEKFEIWAYADKDVVLSLQKSDLVHDFMYEDINNSPFW